MQIGAITDPVFRAAASKIDRSIDLGDYQAASAELRKLVEAEALKAGDLLKLKSLQLKLYNRQQWLVEALPLVQDLRAAKELGAFEWLELALFAVLSADLKAAEECFKRALSLDKRSALLASELAILYEQRGSQQKALAIYEKIFAAGLASKSVDLVFTRVLARLAGLRALTDQEIERLRKLVRRSGGEEIEVRLLFGLAKAYARRGDTDKEIELLVRANAAADFAIEQQPDQQTIEASRGRYKAISSLFEKPAPDWMPRFSTSEARPVFILGMPRSGTTLLEQILGAHSKIENSGESRAMGIAFRRQLENKALQPGDETNPLPFMRYKSLDASDSAAIVEYYHAYQSIFSDAEIITDKELSNIDRVGLIAHMFPNARFICIRRHPLDVCVSILQHDFAQTYFSASSLKIAQEYEVYYQRAEHWEKTFPERVFSLEYETLVANFEATAQSLIQFLGLEWEEGIKSFHERENSVRTPSLSQVRSAVNTASIEKWRRYQRLVEPAEKYLSNKALI